MKLYVFVCTLRIPRQSKQVFQCSAMRYVGDLCCFRIMIFLLGHFFVISLFGYFVFFFIEYHKLSFIDLYKLFTNQVSLNEIKARYFYNYFQKNSNNMKQLQSGNKSGIKFVQCIFSAQDSTNKNYKNADESFSFI